MIYACFTRRSILNQAFASDAAFEDCSPALA